jgi:hypothetical protein
LPSNEVFRLSGVISTVLMKICTDITPRSPLKINRQAKLLCLLPASHLFLTWSILRL